MKFRFLEHTADTKFRAYGKNLNEVFENAALAFTETITDAKKVKPSIKKEFKIKAEDLKSLMYDFLEELLLFSESKRLLFAKFKIIIKNNSLKATAWGEKINDSHELRNLVKAITYNDMTITDKMAQVVLDI
ncbi:MAG: archease [Candidatus Nanoarchaeia archaeon]|jgi:SHS2 domain-containing protein